MAVPIWKKIAKWSLLITPWLLALTLAAGWLLTLWTPGYLERLVPKLAADMGVPLTEFKINSAGLFSADIGPVRIGDGDASLRLANVHVTYTPASLKLGRVHTVTVDGVSVNCSYIDGKFSMPFLGLLPASNTNDTSDTSLPDMPLDTLTVRDSILRCALSDRKLSLPFDAEIAPGDTIKLDLRLRPRDQEILVSGTLGPTLDTLSFSVNAQALRLGAFDDFTPVPLTGRMDLDLTGTLALSHPEALTAEFKTTVSDSDLSGLGLELEKQAEITIQGTLADREISFSMPPVSVAAPFPVTVGVRSGRLSEKSLFAQFTLAGAGVEMGGRLDADKIIDSDRPLWDVSFTAANPENLVVKTGGRVVKLAGFIFSMKGTAGLDSADMVLNCGTRGAGLGRTGLQSGKVRLTLPLAWPLPKSHTPGKLTLSRLRMDKRTLGNVVAKIRQQDMNVAYNGTLFTELLPGLRIPFSGFASMTTDHAAIEFGIRKYSLPPNFDAAAVSPALKGISLSGVIDMNGEFRADDNGLHSRLGAFFTNGALVLSEGSTSISGIKAAFETPDIISLRSAPAQKLSFEYLKAGGIDIRNGEIVYQLEPDGVILVEQAGFQWAGGHVSSRAFRIKPDSKEYSVTMFCSELKLSEILSQLGLAEAQGEAAMSGELPITWKKGNISFNSGFLHSTPGQGGTIRVEAMQDLISSIPKGTPQRGQLELAQEAIRDFQYKWVRIKADTVGEDLLVRLSVDGKPASTLPFVYKKEFGGFMRVTGDVKGSNFQGLRLDVNFSVPLDRILLYKDIVNMIE